MSSVKCNCCGKSEQPHRIVTCNTCKKSYIIDCVDISSAEVRKIHSKSSGLSWSCTNCAQLGNDLNSLKAAIIALQHDIKILKESAQPATSTFSPLDFEKVVQEVADRERRKINLIIYGCREANFKNSKDQVNADVTMFQDLARDAGLDAEYKLSRLGKISPSNSNSCRPIKVTFSTENAVLAMLRSTRELKKNERWSGLSFSRDRTVVQRELYKSVRKELDERISKGESNIRIKYKDGIPTICTNLN